ncbi:hypothetical protein ZWY2020_028247 [Hordeum vulgare]|nr:hypothetical protein ZWY2020_028247 [Hordeum vulgare]
MMRDVVEINATANAHGGCSSIELARNRATRSRLNDVEEDTEAGVDACLIEPVAENNDCSEVRGEKEAPQSQPETELEVRGEMNALQSELGSELQVRAELEASQSEREDIKYNA